MTDHPQRRKVTSADVARESGVSRATVSYVLNNTANRSVSDLTRAHVIDVAKRLGHVPSASARSLRMGRSNVVLCLVPGYDLGELMDRVLESMSRALSNRNYAFLVHRLSPTMDLQIAIRGLWNNIDPALVVVMGQSSRDPLKEAVEATVGATVLQDRIDSPGVGRLQAEYLIGRRYDTIGFALLAGGTTRSIALDRLAGVSAACQESGLPPPRTIELSSSLDQWSDALAMWHESSTGSPAICCHNDDVALRIIAAASQLGLRVPEDLAVIGVDNSPLAQPHLTTIEINEHAVTSEIVERIFQSLNPAHPQLPLLDPTGDVLRLIVRSSA